MSIYNTEICICDIEAIDQGACSLSSSELAQIMLSQSQARLLK